MKLRLRAFDGPRHQPMTRGRVVQHASRTRLASRSALQQHSHPSTQLLRVPISPKAGYDVPQHRIQATAVEHSAVCWAAFATIHLLHAPHHSFVSLSDSRETYTGLCRLHARQAPVTQDSRSSSLACNTPRPSYGAIVWRRLPWFFLGR